ncbi:MAG: hypothetical protein V1849_03120 [Chloroflexota bacterium]
MPLTYENMKACVEKFFDTLPTVEPKTADNLRQLLTPDFNCRWRAENYNREQWVDHVCRHHFEYRATIDYKNPPFYITVDEKKHIVSTYMREEFRHPVTRELIDSITLVCHYECVLVGNEVRIKSELIAQVPQFISGFSR